MKPNFDYEGGSFDHLYRGRLLDIRKTYGSAFLIYKRLLMITIGEESSLIHERLIDLHPT